MESYFSLWQRSFPLILKGCSTTAEVFVIAALISMLLGLLMGILICDRLKVPIVSSLLEFLTFVLRGIPFYVQLLIFYFVLPELIGFNLSSFAASVISLGICSSGYVAQLVRGAMNAIPADQWEAAFTLGYSQGRCLLHIIIPQMARIVLPSLNNELDSLLKSTSIVSTIGMLELTRVGMNLVSREMEPVPIYLGIAVIYLCFSSVLNGLFKKMESRLMYAKSR